MFAIDHAESTHDEEGNLTEYGEWWVEEFFPAWLKESEEATKKSEEEVRRWR